MGDIMSENKHAKKGSSSIAVKILLLVLVFIIVAGCSFVIYRFVFAKPKTNTPATKPDIPTWNIPTQTQATTIAPTENEDLKYQELAKKYMASMTETEKISQLFIVNPELLTGVDTVTEAGDMTKEALTKYNVGGILYSAKNLENAEQTAELIKNSQSFAKTKMFIAVSEEGGTVSPCADKLGTTKFNSMYSYRKDGAETAKKNAKTIATDIKKFGFNLNFAPVADVYSDKNSKLIGERAYSDDFKEAEALIPEAVKGFREGGVIPALKHFIGTGEATQTEGQKYPYVTKTKEELVKQELSEFKAGIDAGAEIILVGNVVIKDIDATCPASMSEKVVNGFIRDALKYDKIIITDNMQMKSITDAYGTKDVVVRSLKAGADMILMPDDLDAAFTAVWDAIEKGEIKQSQLENSVLKILTLKYKYGILQ